jgi:TonB family protein
MRLQHVLSLVMCGSMAGSAVAARPSSRDPHYSTQGITADGRVITVPPGKLRPWLLDKTKEITPHLPASELAKHHEGEGLFRVILHSEKGTVRQVVVVKSSGYPLIDQTIVDALQQWTFRPHRWKEFEIYVGLWPKQHGSNQSLQPTAGRCVAQI